MEKSKRNSIAVWACLVLFFIVFACCLPKVSDDWQLQYLPASGSFYEYVRGRLLYMWSAPNGDGRLIGNCLAHINSNISFVRVLYWTGIMSLLVLYIDKLTQATTRRWWWTCLPVLLVFLSPKAWFAGDISWTCGFSIYVPPFAILLVCLYQLRNIFYDKPVTDTWRTAVLCLVLGFCGQLFSEIITFYVCIVSLGFVLWHGLRFKRISSTTVCYCLGAAMGAFLMSRSPAYAGYAAQDLQEYVYLRSVGFSVGKMLKIFRTVYDQVSAYSLEANLVPVALISACGLGMLGRSEGKRRAVSVAAAAILAAAPIYFFINASDLVVYEELVSLLPMGQVLGGDLPAILLDMVVYAAYVLSVAYVLLACGRDIYCKSLGCFFLASCLLCTVPLCITYPLSHRVFFSAYMFLVLLGLLMLDNLLLGCTRKNSAAVTAVLSATVAVCLLYLAVFSMNPRIERQKISYIEYCMARGDTTIQIPKFVFEQRLYLPETAPVYNYYYEEVEDIAFTFVPYEEWLATCYRPSGLS